LLFVGGRIWARRTHLAFEPKDVAAAIETLLDDTPHSMDNWDLFLSWPIKDPYCEHIRQECIRAIDEHPPVRNEFVSNDAARRIAALLARGREASYEVSGIGQADQGGITRCAVAQ
jgi:hypothetical protein